MKIGVLGAGWWGKNIINTFEHIPEIEEVHYFDPDSKVQEKFILNKKSIFHTSIDSIIYNIDIQGLCIATPPSNHFELTEKALLSGKHVFVEKPPAFKATDIKKLGEIADAKRLVYMLDALFLFLEPIKKLKEILTSGLLQDIRYVEMYRIGDELRREGAGLERIQKTMFHNHTDVIEDLFFHDAGILLSLLPNLKYKEIKKEYFYNSTLCDTARIEFISNSFPVILTLSWVLTGRKRGLSIYDKNYIVEYNGLASENQIIIHDLKKNNKEELTFSNRPPLQSILEFFIRAIQNLEINHINYNFMGTIINYWEEIRNAN